MLIQVTKESYDAYTESLHSIDRFTSRPSVRPNKGSIYEDDR